MRTAAVNVITSFIDHLLGARPRLIPEGESTKFRSEQRDAVVLGRICSFIKLLAHEEQSSLLTSLSWRLIRFDSD
jgi:hypothetical protein